MFQRVFCSIFLSACLVVCLSTQAYATTPNAMDTTNYSDIPFAVNGQPIMDLTLNGLTVTRSGKATNDTWAGNFTGHSYGLYSYGTSWAGYFNGPVNVNGQLYVNGSPVKFFGGMYTSQSTCTSCMFSACGAWGSSYGGLAPNPITGGYSCPSWAPNSWSVETGSSEGEVNPYCSTATTTYLNFCTN